MKILTKLEKSKSFWFLLIISFVFFLLRLPSIIEPYWYGDEGIYQVIGQALNQGHLLYRDIWDNKPPLLYVVYALFAGNQADVRLTSLIVGLLSIAAFFYLSKILFKKLSSSIISTSLFAILFATPVIEGNIANAENFMLLPIITAGLIIYQLTSLRGAQEATWQSSWGLLRFARNDKLLFIAGLLLGIAFLFKIVAIFDLAAFLLFFCITNLAHKFHWKSLRPLLLTSCFLLLSFLLPLLFTIFYFLTQGALTDFIKGAFLGNVGYVGYGNKFLNIPQGFLILKFLLLTTAVLLILFRRKYLSRSMIFIFLWVAFSLFNAFFSQRPYTHYVLVLLPAFSLLTGFILDVDNKRLKLILTTSLVIIILLIAKNFWINNLKKTTLYYQNAIFFVLSKKDLQAYQSFFDRKTPGDYEIASFIKTHTNPEDKIFIWGNSAQIYALSHKLPPNKYTVAYHIVQNEQATYDTQIALYTAKPKYIIILSDTPPMPLQITMYSLRFGLTRAIIYERDF